MFNDQKESAEGQAETSVKEATDKDVNTKAKTYCEEKFKASLPNSYDSSYSTTKQKLIAFCTTDGIKTVKGRLIQSQKKDGINENGDDEKWKTVFAVYRYNDDFIDGLKEDSKDNSLNKESKANEHHTKLKTACINLLKKNHREIKDNKYFNYGSWWCVDLGYTTIKEKIKKGDSTWNEKQDSDSDWGEVKEKGKDTAEVKKGAAKANDSSNEDDELTEESLKKLCGSDNISSKLFDDDSYQDKYLVIKSVCQKTS